jgi:predicted amidohydrolase
MKASDSSSSELSIAVCELTSVDDVEANVRQILELLKSIADPENIDLICLPENCLYLHIDENLPRVSLDLRDASIRKLADWARLHEVYLHLGSVPLREAGGRVANASLLLTADGDVQVVYRKIHLFDVDVEGHKPVRESDYFSAGERRSVFRIRDWVFGSSICYDLRFAELYSAYALVPVDVILIPSAFLVPTGSAHWQVLVRARAIENQAYVLAAAQGGTHFGVQGGGNRQTYGHSLAVDPWGVVLVERESDKSPRVLRAVLSKGRLTQVRRQIPMAAHRRLLTSSGGGPAVKQEN